MSERERDGMRSEAEPEQRRRLLARPFRLGLFGVAALLAVGAPYWAPLLLARMDFFRVRRVEIVGARYVSADEVLARLRVDTTRSVWEPTAPLAARVATHPQVRRAEVTRRLPGTLVVVVEENLPVALVPTPQGFRAYDALGMPLPLDPARIPVDAPVLPLRDTTMLRLLGALRLAMPAVYERVSEVRPVGTDELLFAFAEVPVRAMRDVSIERFADVAPVEEDLTRRHLRASEIDLRFRDQVIARLP